MASPNAITQAYVSDCITYRLTMKESMAYMVSRKHTCSPATFKRYKRKIINEKGLQVWFNEHTQIGFVREHRLRMLEIDTMYRKMARIYAKEIEKENPNIYNVTTLTKLLIMLNIRMSELNLGNPIISKIKLEIDLKYGEITKGILTSGTDDSLREAIFD